MTAPGGNAETDKGPITAVQVTKGGSGYAKIGRVAPTVTVTGTSGSGTDATFAVTLASSKDSCGVDRWAVSKVVRTGGTDYVDGDTLTFAIAEGDTQETEAAAKIAGTTYAEPTLSLSVPGGTGAVLQIDGYTKSGDYWGWNDFSDTWRISGITVANGGTGYTNDTLVTVTLGQDDEARPGAGSDLRIRTGFRAPNDDWTLQNGSPAPTGTGLVLSLTLVAHPTDARTFWVNSWAITNGGTGYAVGQRIRPLANEGNNAASPLRANLEITAVDGNGAVTALALFGTTTFTQNQSRGRYSIETGVITSVENLFAQAGWRKVITNSDGVVVTNGGFYYREDESAPAYVSPVTIAVTQSPPSAGTGASLSAVIDNDPQSETFGQITAVTIGSGGDGYLAYEWCESNLQGTTVVLPRDSVIVEQGEFIYLGGCIYRKADCGRVFNVEYRGPSIPPRIVLQTTCNFQQVWYELEASENVANCSQIAFTASDSIGRSASVSAGGVATESGCNICTGHVLVNGVQVPINPFLINPPGNYTLVSVDSAPTIVTAPESGLQQLYRTYAVAQAQNFGCANFRGEPEMWIRFWFWLVVVQFGGYNLNWQEWEIMAEFDALTVGSLRANNPFFTTSYSYVYDAYEDRLLGAIRGNACVGQDWHFLGGYDTYPGLGAPIGFPPVPDPPSAVVARVETRQAEKGTFQCGPI